MRAHFYPMGRHLLSLTFDNKIIFLQCLTLADQFINYISILISQYKGIFYRRSRVAPEQNHEKFAMKSWTFETVRSDRTARSQKIDCCICSERLWSDLVLDVDLFMSRANDNVKFTCLKPKLIWVQSLFITVALYYSRSLFGSVPLWHACLKRVLKINTV